MAKWVKICKEFSDVRELIDKVDSVGVMKSLLNICRKYSRDKKFDFAYDFETLGDEMEDELLDEDNVREDKDVADYYLSEFYDLCDAARIWLAWVQ